MLELIVDIVILLLICYLQAWKMSYIKRN